MSSRSTVAAGVFRKIIRRRHMSVRFSALTLTLGRNMDKYLSSAVVLGACLLGALPAWSADPVKIGFITTLSGPLGYAGQDALDGFRLAIEDGKLGGVPVRVLSEDDGFNPSSA